MSDDYFKLLERLVKGAEYLENPIIKPDEYRKGMELYEAIDEKIERYLMDCTSRGHTIEDSRVTEPVGKTDGQADAA